MGYNDANSTLVNSVGNLYGVKVPEGSFIRDPEKLLYQYDNLIRKLGKQYSAYFHSLTDIQDLYAYIKDTFISLVLEYDPYGGVDFPGYIVLKLPQRIYYSYIEKQFNDRERTILLKSSAYSVEDLVDTIRTASNVKAGVENANNMVLPQRFKRVQYDKQGAIMFAETEDSLDPEIEYQQLLQAIAQDLALNDLKILILAIYAKGVSKYNQVIAEVLRMDNSYTYDEVATASKELKADLKEYLAPFA